MSYNGVFERIIPYPEAGCLPEKSPGMWENKYKFLHMWFFRIITGTNEDRQK